MYLIEHRIEKSYNQTMSNFLKSAKIIRFTPMTMKQWIGWMLVWLDDDRLPKCVKMLYSFADRTRFSRISSEMKPTWFFWALLYNEYHEENKRNKLFREMHTYCISHFSCISCICAWLLYLKNIGIKLSKEAAQKLPLVHTDNVEANDSARENL